jgi:hypothetical protein
VVLKTTRFQPNRYRNKRQTQILAQVKKKDKTVENYKNGVETRPNGLIETMTG